MVDHPVTRFGVLGTGRITRRLVADLQSTDGVVVSAIASRQQQRAQWCAQQYGVGNAVEGYEQLLQRDDIDAVYLSLPPSMHAQWSIAAAKHGKHVLCEKPLATTLEEAISIDQACREYGVRWLDATAWLHHDRTKVFEDWLAEEKFGTVGHISASVSFFEPFQSGEHRLDASLGGGCLLDLGWYTCGVVALADGGQSMSVQARAVLRDGVSMRVTGMFFLDDGSSATISCGYDTATRKWFEIAGSKSSLICDDFTRPWADRPTRCWVHDATGSVESQTFQDHQERSMISRLVGDHDLSKWQRQALKTQAMLDAMSQSCLNDGERVEVAFPA